MASGVPANAANAANTMIAANRRGVAATQPCMTWPSLSPGATDRPTSFGFEPAFFDRTRAAEAGCPVARQAGPTDAATGTAPERPPGYDVPALAGEFRQLNDRFLKSADGARVREEWTGAFRALLAFARGNRLHQAERQFLKLQNFRQVHQGPAVGGEIELYRPDYKPQLEALVRHLGNERIRLEDRCGALERLEGLDLCPARHRTEITREALRLQGMGGGLGAAVWSAYSERGQAHLRELLRAEPQLAHLDFSTPHALHPFAAALRLPGHSHRSDRNDAYVVDVRIHEDVVRRCGLALERRLGMTMIAQHLADECLREVRETLTGKTGGAALDLCHGRGHWGELEETVQALAGRFGDLHIRDVVELNGDGEPRGLTDDARILTVRIRHNMTRQQIAPAPKEQLLERRAVDGEPQRFMLFEGRWPYVVDDRAGEGATPLLRLPTAEEIEGLLRPAPGPRVLPAARFDETVRRALAAFAETLPRTDQDTAAATRERVAANPTVEGLRTVIERQGLDDPALAAWLDEAAPQWEAAALDTTLQLLIGSRRAAPLAALLAAWRVEGFADSWQRCVRDQAVRDRALNTDARVQGRHEDGDLPGQGTRPPQQRMLERIEQGLGAIAPLSAVRASLQTFRARHPAGGDRRADAVGPDLPRLLDALRTLRDGPARLLSAPLLAEHGGFSDALESTFYALGAGRLQDELELIGRIAVELPLSPEETVALLQVTDRHRIPVPASLVGSALLTGRDFVMDPLFTWAIRMFWDGRLDASAARRLLLPDVLEAEQALSFVKSAPVLRALKSYLRGLDAACDLGVLQVSDLAAAAGTSSDEPCALLRSAAQRGGAAGVALLEEWRSKFR